VSGSWREQLLAAHGVRYLLIASPEPYLAAVVTGAAVVLRRRRESNLRTARLALAVGFAFIGFFSFPGIFATDGLRYLMPAVPCLALVGGIAVGLAVEWTRRRVHQSLHRALWLVFLGWLWWPVASTHPFEITYFNDVSGGFAGARARGLPGASDYWAISYREIVRWLDRHAEPHALLYTPFAPHLIATNDELRDDLELLRTDVNWCALGQKSVYLFYVTREDVYWQNPIFDVCEKHLVPLEAFRSQGAPVAKIFHVDSGVMCRLLANAPPRVS
jgi:hypothetical protein